MPSRPVGLGGAAGSGAPAASARRGARDELARRARVVREERDAHACGRQGVAQAGAKVGRGVAVGLGGEDAQRAAADAGDRVLRPQRPAKGVGRGADRLVTVDLDGEQRERPLVAGVAQHLVLEALGEQRAVVHRSAFGPGRKDPSGSVAAMDGKAKLVGINHIALEVGDLDAALELYERLFQFGMRGRMRKMAFIDMGDQFLAVAEGRRQEPDDGRHFGLVVDDVDAARAAVAAEGLELMGGRRGQSFDFRDPWGNRFQVVGYRNIQFERTDGVRRKLGIEDLEKTDAARGEIAERGLAS
jgi:lactoylglutathione lyase